MDDARLEWLEQFVVPVAVRKPYRELVAEVRRLRQALCEEVALTDRQSEELNLARDTITGLAERLVLVSVENLALLQENKLLAGCDEPLL